MFRWKLNATCDLYTLNQRTNYVNYTLNLNILPRPYLSRVLKFTIEERSCTRWSQNFLINPGIAQNLISVGNSIMIDSPARATFAIPPGRELWVTTDQSCRAEDSFVFTDHTHALSQRRMARWKQWAADLHLDVTAATMVASAGADRRRSTFMHSGANPSKRLQMSVYKSDLEININWTNIPIVLLWIGPNCSQCNLSFVRFSVVL